MSGSLEFRTPRKVRPGLIGLLACLTLAGAATPALARGGHESRWRDRDCGPRYVDRHHADRHHGDRDRGSRYDRRDYDRRDYDRRDYDRRDYDRRDRDCDRRDTRRCEPRCEPRYERHCPPPPRCEPPRKRSRGGVSVRIVIDG